MKTEIQTKLELAEILVKNLDCKDTSKALSPLYEYIQEELIIPRVTPRFSVSLVYQNPNANMLRTLATDANSKEEALGIAIKYFEKETDGFGLILKSVTLLN
ncbi:hypothetical protein ACJRPK_14005 [Aquimarina sp. 2-A2]|uniref:hypothetical protein n=1 Tax=Aquimarina sp. 2-A2 TaxID=3382644 RepID=UPI00387F05AF